MKLLHAGDKGKAACEQCKKIVTTTFDYRDVPFRHGDGMVKDLLVAVCDRCDSVVAIPAQSTPAIRDARKPRQYSVEVKLPAPYIDMLDMGSFRIDPKASPRFRKVLVSYFIHKHARAIDQIEKSALAKIIPEIPARKRAMKALPQKRLSFKFTDHLITDLDLLTSRLAVNRTILLAGMAEQIRQDIVESKNPADLEELEKMAAITQA